MADKYPIFGVDSLGDPYHLHTADDSTEADRWVKQYIRSGDWGGYQSIWIYESPPDQDPETINMIDAPIIGFNKDGENE